jgi:23S rRNA pseudouridine1911/1915/1917 synthase
MTRNPESSGDQRIERLAAYGGDRLDRFLAGQLDGVSRAEIQRWIAEQRVAVNGRSAKPSYRLALAESVPLAIVYEDSDLLVVDKPAGMVAHPAPGHVHGTLVNALLGHNPGLAAMGGPERAGVVHRLDRDTSGLLLVAKTMPAFEALQRQFKTRRVQKTYLALVDGAVNVPEGRIEAPIGRDPAHRQRMAVVSETRGGRRSVTLFRVLKHYGTRTGQQRHEVTLLELDLLTGRTHQIRVHLAFLKHPVVGDRVYGQRRPAVHCPRQFLHAMRLSFKQPETGVNIVVEAPLPLDLQNVLGKLVESASP